MTFLIDEIESHLHPRWQRTIVGSLLAVMAKLAGKAAVQIIAATHSPLLLASIEPLFNARTDAWFDLDLVREDGDARVELTQRDFVRRGDVSAWLTSEAFDLKEARSLEAETAIREALALARQPSPSKEDIKRVQQLLQASLSDIDRFWLRWVEFRSKHHAPRKGARK